MTNRRAFFKQLAGIGLFSILPGAGRIWKAQLAVRPISYPTARKALGLNTAPDSLLAFITATKSIPDEIYSPAYRDYIWKKLARRGQFPKKAGETVRPIADA